MPIGDLNDLPVGGIKRVQIGDDKEEFIVVVRPSEHRLVALLGKCCHLGAPMNGGYCDGSKIYCP